MIEKIKRFFSKNVLEAEEETTTPDQLATAALLIEVMVIDGNLDAVSYTHLTLPTILLV